MRSVLVHVGSQYQLSGVVVKVSFTPVLWLERELLFICRESYPLPIWYTVLVFTATSHLPDYVVVKGAVTMLHLFYFSTFNDYLTFYWWRLNVCAHAHKNISCINLKLSWSSFLFEPRQAFIMLMWVNLHWCRQNVCVTHHEIIQCYFLHFYE